MAMLIAMAFTGGAAAQDVVPSHGHAQSRLRLFPWQLPSDTGHYRGYHVGGGSTHPHLSEPRRDDEGTWGWDYRGWLLPRRVMPGWWHGRRMQGGTGAYRTDGPSLHREK
jgi:hypothetical protein